MSTNVLKINYRTKHTNANTIYTTIAKDDVRRIMNTLSIGLYKMIQRSNFDERAVEFLHTQHKMFRKHTDAGKGQYNTLGSFVGGLLEQHQYDDKKDISEKMLEGITLATSVFNDFDENSPVVEFVHEGTSAQREPDTIYDKFFQE